MIKIIDTAYRGNGVGRTSDGKAVFVPYTVTGDEIRIKITEDKGSYAIGELQEIVKPSDWRRDAHYPHHGSCGGCHFGHIRYEKQLEIKRNILLQALRKHPQQAMLAENLKVFSAEPLGYRIRANVRMMDSKAGFYKANSHDFIPVPNCPVIKPSLWEKCLRFAAACDGSALSVMENVEGLAIALTDGKLCEQPYFNGLSDGEKHIGLSHLEYATPAGVVPVAYGGFFQSNSLLNADFQRYAADLAAGASSILELYAGSGFFTAALMQQASVNAIELNAAAAKLGRQYGYPIRTADVSDIQKEKSSYDTIFLDPPRDGVDKKTLAAVLDITPERIVYVSCNPMTAARDLQRLEGSYKIAEMALFDMFPQTYHVETVSLLERIKKRSQQY